MGNDRLVSHAALGGLLALLATQGCGAGVGSVNEASATLRPEVVWGPHLGNEASGEELDAGAQRYRGVLFALRASDASLDGAVWIRCKLEVSYRYEPAPAGPVRVEIRSLEDLVRFFPASQQELRPGIEAGQPLRIEYAIAGRFVVDAPSPRAASIVCPAATHYVNKIAVGAYRVVEGEPLPVGANAIDGATERFGDVRTETVGRLTSCSTPGVKGPTEGCVFPLAFDLRAIPGHDPAQKLRLDEIAGRGDFPSVDTMPGSSVAGAARVGFEACHLTFRPTGDVTRDLATLTALCGAPTGMVPHSEVLTGWQAASSEASTYGMRFEAGGCYRAFGVGGSTVQDLDMAWRDTTGKVLARDVRPDGWAVLAPAGPTCVEKAGDYELAVSVERGQGPFAVQVWRLPQTAKPPSAAGHAR